LFEEAVEVEYVASPPASDPTEVTMPPGQAVVVAGQTVRIRGSGLTGADAAAVFLRPSVGVAEWPVTAWRVFGTSASGTAGDADELVLEFPPNYAAVPATGTALTATPLPGNYLLTVGNPGSVFRSNALALAIAPQMDGIGPSAAVLVPDGTGLYTMAASGLVAGATQVVLDATALTIGGAAAPGVAVVNAAAGSISWMLPSPTGFPSKSYVQVLVVVNGIQSPPGWWVQMP
jgi:hypothetical protein